MIDAPTNVAPSPGFVAHRLRGPFNSAFFAAVGPYLEWNLRRYKRRVFGQLPATVVELGSGVGPNLRYLPRGASLVAVEPNPHMHRRLRTAAERRGVELDLRPRTAEDTGLADHSVDAVISSLVLCTVPDPAAVVAEVRRILRPGGTFHFVEHVVARRRTPTRALQRLFRRPWAWTFEGCSCERDLAAVIHEGEFAAVDIESYRLHTPFVPFNTHIGGVARA